MKLRNISAYRIGPFFTSFSEEIDDRVTILTGANDAGKSSLLRVIELALSDAAIDSSFINHDHIQKSQKKSSEDSAITVGATMTLTEADDVHHGAYTVTPGDIAQIQRTVAKQALSKRVSVNFKKHGSRSDISLRLPVIIKPGVDDSSGINDIIDLKNPTRLEKALLDTAFKAPFNFERLADMQQLQYTRAIREAQDELNRLIERILPHPGMIRFDLMAVAGDISKLTCFVRDRHDGITPFGTRGSGVQRIVTLIAELITTNRNAKHRIVLMDEPENSLHPDAQHLLREFLYDLTANGRTQVIYATHSAAMINPMRGEQVRVLVRSKIEETATTESLSRPTENNFLGLRTSLGMSAADSLLFAPVTVITEGATEVACLPVIAEKLDSGGKLQKYDVKKLLGLISIMDGMGDSFEFLCRLAKSHGTRVVLFLDGDKRRRVEQLNIKETHKDVPLVLLPDEKEFEELVASNIYLQALAELAGLTFPADVETQIDTWVMQMPNRRRFAYSKKVEGWFRDTFDADFPPKKNIMQKAIELADVSEIDEKPITELLDGIICNLQGTSFL